MFMPINDEFHMVLFAIRVRLGMIFSKTISSR